MANIFRQKYPLFCLLLCSIVLTRGNKSIRLAGSIIPLEGRVEVFHNGEWGTVCSNGWSSHSNNKDVVCRELGYAQGRAFNHEYPGTGTIWLDGVVCSGNEGSLINCTHKTMGDTNCSHDQDVTVQCEVCKRPIVSSADKLVQDWSFSSSSYRNNDKPHLARLKSTGAWCLPEIIDMDLTHYLEVELPRLYLVSAVATLGGVRSLEYVTSYSVVYSVDGRVWKNTSVDGNQVIKGNIASGNDDVQTRLLDAAVRAKFLRYIPLGWGRVACMRVDICGHQLPHYPTVIVKEQASSAILSWSTPDSGDEEIRKYYVRYWKTSEGKTSRKILESATNAEVLVSNLRPFTEYNVEISGVSELGEGLAREIRFTTLETAPSGSPTRISFQFLGKNAVNITWAPPDEDKRNGIIIAYIICFPPPSAKSGECKDTITLPGSKTWYVLRDRDFSSQLVVKIQAQTKKGIGPVGRATSGVLEYTSPDGVASSLIIAITCGVILLALILVVILAVKGVILKNFVTKLRKLTSSQMTMSATSDAYKPNTSPVHVLPNEETRTAENLYNNTSQQITENLYDYLENVRKQTIILTEQNIYGNDGPPLLSTQDQFANIPSDQVTIYATNEQNEGAYGTNIIDTENDQQHAIYQYNTSNNLGNPYDLNSLPIDSHEIHTKDVQIESETQGYNNPTSKEQDNVYIYEHAANSHE